VTLITREQAAGRSIVVFATRDHSRPTVGDHGLNAAGALPPPSTEISETALMAERIRELENSLERERSERQEACEAALAAGREEGKREAESDAADRLRILREALERAASEVSEAIDQRGDLAVAISRAALSKIFGEGNAFGPMVEAIVRQYLAQAASGTVIGVRVSADDFADDASLATLSAVHASVRIVREAKLAAGSCLFDLTLGTVDGSVAVQAQAVDTLLAANDGGVR
jgi:flagellar assembly protein FliH